MYHRLKRRFYVGLDLGKRLDYSVVAVVEECVWATGERDMRTYEPIVKKLAVLRSIERVPKKTEYSQVVEKVKRMLTSEALRDKEVVLALDGTGVGEAVFEMVMKMYWEAREQRTKWLNLAAVVFSSGGKTRWEDYHAFVPKNTLMEGLQLGMESKEVRLAANFPGMADLLREMRNMQIERGQKQLRWVSVGEHDDLVMALALAVWGRTFRPLGMGWKDLKLGELNWPPEV